MKFHLILICSFLQFFPNSTFSKHIINNIYQQYIEGNHYFLNNFFEKFNQGTILFDTSNNIKMVIEESIFQYCSNSNFGGAITFNCHGESSSVLNKVCGFQCFSTHSNGGQFSYFKTNNIQYYILTSIFNCSNIINGYFGMMTTNGNILLNNHNCSNNRLNDWASIRSYNFYSCSYLFSTFCNNFASNIIIGFHYGNSNSNFSNSNIINNSANNYATVYAGGASSKIFDCIFYDNQNYLFCVITYGFISINNCYILHQNIYFLSGHDVSIFFTNTISSFTNSFNLFHIKLGLCDGNYLFQSNSKYNSKILFCINFFIILIFLI